MLVNNGEMVLNFVTFMGFCCVDKGFVFLGSCIEFEDVEGDDDDDDDMVVDYPCPFCSDDYDLVELCHHIDEEHQLDANNGVNFNSYSSPKFHRLFLCN